MDHRDPSLWRRLPEPGDAVPEGQADGGRPRARHYGLRQVRRLSNWTAAGLVAATAATAGYFAHVSTSASTIERMKVGMMSHFRIMIMRTGKIGTI